MNETGVVKFRYESNRRELAPFPGFEELNAARSELRRLGLLGVDESGIGFGNISLRDGTNNCFYITGSGTGAMPELTLHDYARVLDWDFKRNWLRCEGLVVASAESLTHAAVYATNSGARVVLHGHDSSLWSELQKRGLASREIPYGTPEMALEVQRLFLETSVLEKRIFAMAGHAGGIVAFGENFGEALAALAIPE